jgi:hypothetical protein
MALNILIGLFFTAIGIAVIWAIIRLFKETKQEQVKKSRKV